MSDHRRRLLEASERYRRAQEELQLARDALTEEIRAASENGWTQRAMEPLIPVTRMTIHNWVVRRRAGPREEG